MSLIVLSTLFRLALAIQFRAILLFKTEFQCGLVLERDLLYLQTSGFLTKSLLS